ncbi:MAG: hypothetical protein L3K09_03200 [Thermoplasmata archaeon]|nr:hypothetical protein [Thermoplasmata archaeon]
MRAETPREIAWAFHEILMEILRRLNKEAEDRRDDVEGLEMIELARSMRLFWAMHVGDQNFEDAVALLVENGLLAERTNEVYAWDRERLVGRRYVITTLGKDYLNRQIEDSNRIR